MPKFRQNRVLIKSDRTDLYDKGRLLIVENVQDVNYNNLHASVVESEHIWCKFTDITENMNMELGLDYDNSQIFVSVICHINDWNKRPYNMFEIDEEYFRYMNGTLISSDYINLTFTYVGDNNDANI